jgi:hypothetical protein
MAIDTTGWEPNFKPNCQDGSVNGTKSAAFDYIVKSVTPDYPGSSQQYSISGYNYDVRG